MTSASIRVGAINSGGSSASISLFVWAASSLLILYANPRISGSSTFWATAVNTISACRNSARKLS